MSTLCSLTSQWEKKKPLKKFLPKYKWLCQIFKAIKNIYKLIFDTGMCFSLFSSLQTKAAVFWAYSHHIVEQNSKPFCFLGILTQKCQHLHSTTLTFLLAQIYNLSDTWATSQKSHGFKTPEEWPSTSGWGDREEQLENLAIKKVGTIILMSSHDNLFSLTYTLSLLHFSMPLTVFGEFTSK